MNTFENKKRLVSYLEVSEDVIESQVLISLGEEALARAHRVSHEIEEHVRRLLNGASATFCPITTDQGDQFLSNPHAEDEQGEV